jgi:DNA-binding transcriptional regulator YdaS (Cro superfamily)
MKNLSSYLTDTGTSQTAMASGVGISKTHMSQLVSGARDPSIELALKIERATAGVVAVETWKNFACLAHRYSGAAQ